MADVFELTFEGFRRRHRRRPEHVDEVLIRGSESRTRLEVVAQRGADAAIRRAAGKPLVVEQLAERPERGVEIREPDRDELFACNGAVWNSRALAGEPVPCGLGGGMAGGGGGVVCGGRARSG